MTEQLNEVVDTTIETPVAETVVEEIVNQTDVNQEKDIQDTQTEGDSDSLGDKTEWPDKFENAYSRKKKQVNKLRSELEQVKAKLAEFESLTSERKSVNADDFETWDDYNRELIKAELQSELTQSQREQQKAQLTQQQQQLMAERNQYIAEQKHEVAQTLSDYDAVVNPYVPMLDNLKPQVQEMFYSIDNAPAAIYVLAKEGKLESLSYAHPQIAANEIWAANQRGMEMLNSKTQKQISSAPEPMRGSKGQVKTTKNLMEGSVLRNLGLKS